jgi:hypothetical protein
VVSLILLMQAADDKSVLGEIFDALDKLVEASVQATATIFTVKSFARSELTVGFMVAYVYLACWLLVVIARFGFRSLADLFGQYNILGMRGVIARERGAQAYRAWLPLERIRPTSVSQHEWEETYAWPADNKPPYPPFGQRLLRGAIGYVVAFVVLAILLQAFTPLPVLNWVVDGARRVIGF